MATHIRFYGVAAYEIINSQGRHILIDPFLDGNPGSPIKSHQLEQVDLICVTHAASDHLGDAEAIAKRTGAPVLCGGEIRAYLLAKGIPQSQLRAATWGLLCEVNGLRVRPVECHHWSQMFMPDGQHISGVPMGFIIYADPNVRFYHYGDTALFSDLKLIAQLYKPTIGAIGITDPVEIAEAPDEAAGRILTGEMDPYEGSLAAQWLGLEVVLPCHYINPDCDDVRAFNHHIDEAKARGERAPESLVLKPGDEIVLKANGKLMD